MRIAPLAPRARLRVVIGGGVVAALTALAACSACGRRAPGGAGATTGQDALDAGALPAHLVEDAAALRVPLMWESAKNGDAEDLATLAAHEGAMGLVEAAGDPSLRVTAIHAMGYAHGWAQLPFLATVAGANDDEEASAALDATLELATRPRTSEDPEDASELREGCGALLALARDTARERSRRVAAIRALRMLPCPPIPDGGELPADVDAK